MSVKALFLDRDGVINVEKNYIYQIKDVEFVNGIFDLCLNFQKNGFLIIVITNQAGISRGYYSDDDFKILTSWMKEEFSRRNILISDIYFCPHYPTFDGPCQCRKPNPKMILDAAHDHNIDLSESVLIGDKISDIEAGRNAGVGLNILISPNFIPSEIINFCK